MSYIFFLIYLVCGIRFQNTLNLSHRKYDVPELMEIEKIFDISDEGHLKFNVLRENFEYEPKNG